jgi:hypothetical protein
LSGFQQLPLVAFSGFGEIGAGSITVFQQLFNGFSAVFRRFFAVF